MVQIIPSELFVGPPELKNIRQVTGPERMRRVDKISEQPKLHETLEQVGGSSFDNENQRQTAMKTERRTYCRRIYRWLVLEELRSSVERRHHDNEGWSGPVTHIDEEV